MTIEILVLLLAFQAKHLIADYYLQFPYMYENKGKVKGWKFPLANHALIHAIGTILIFGIYFLGYTERRPTFDINLFILGIALFDFTTHFVIDRWKATQKGGPDTKSFWTNLGIDQMLHHTVGILIVFSITLIK